MDCYQIVNDWSMVWLEIVNPYTGLIYIFIFLYFCIFVFLYFYIFIFLYFYIFIFLYFYIFIFLALIQLTLLLIIIEAKKFSVFLFRHLAALNLMMA